VNSTARTDPGNEVRVDPTSRPKRQVSDDDIVAQLLPEAVVFGTVDVVDTGCDECENPVTRVKRLKHKLWVMTVLHDDDCPFLARYRAGGAAR
jgi:hypothetical protein